MSMKAWLVERFRPLSLGERGERAAARYLRRRRMKVIAVRHRRRYGEIDIIAVDGRTVVFVEVKTRRTELGISPAEAVDAVRRARMTRAAAAFLKSHRLLEYPARFDIVEVIWPAAASKPTIRHHASAFEAAGTGHFFR